MSTVETIRFSLLDGVDAADFRQRNAQVENEFMKLRPGFLARQTAVSEDGEWLVVVHWASAADAEATINSFFGAPETQHFLAAIDKSTVQSGRYQVVERA